MKEFDLLCKEFEQMDPVSYDVFLTTKSAEIIPILSAAAKNGITGTTIFFSFILGAIGADGKLTEPEYELVAPVLKMFFGDSINYEAAKKSFRALKRETKELKKVVEQMIDIIGLFSEELKEDIIIICMMICAVDGKITLKEKKWIMQLIAQ